TLLCRAASAWVTCSTIFAASSLASAVTASCLSYFFAFCTRPSVALLSQPPSSRSTSCWCSSCCSRMLAAACSNAVWAFNDSAAFPSSLPWCVCNSPANRETMPSMSTSCSPGRHPSSFFSSSAASASESWYSFAARFASAPQVSGIAPHGRHLLLQAPAEVGQRVRETGLLADLAEAVLSDSGDRVHGLLPGVLQGLRDLLCLLRVGDETFGRHGEPVA